MMARVHDGTLIQHAVAVHELQQRMKGVHHQEMHLGVDGGRWCRAPLSSRIPHACLFTPRVHCSSATNQLDGVGGKTGKPAAR